MMQKITIVFFPKCERCKTRAMKIASSEGVKSVAMDGDKLVVVGEDVDVRHLMNKLTKNRFRQARVLMVEEVKSKETLAKEEEEEKEKKKKKEEEEEKAFKEKVLKRSKECRSWACTLNKSPPEESANEHQCCRPRPGITECCKFSGQLNYFFM